MVSLPADRRRRTLLTLGAALTVIFVALRWTNVYGDPQPWSTQKNALFTVMSFLNCAKYPPSLLYLLITLGPAIMFLALLDRPAGPVSSKIRVYGRVPFFFYVLHIPLIHAMAILGGLLLYGPASLSWGPLNPAPADAGLGLPGVYACWLFAVAILYFPCRWFAGLKQRNKAAWLSYF